MFERLSGEAFLSSQMRVATFGRRSGEILRRLQMRLTMFGRRSGEISHNHYVRPQAAFTPWGAARPRFFEARRCDSERSGESRRRSQMRFAMFGHLSGETCRCPQMRFAMFGRGRVFSSARAPPNHFSYMLREIASEHHHLSHVDA